MSIISTAWQRTFAIIVMDTSEGSHMNAGVDIGARQVKCVDRSFQRGAAGGEGDFYVGKKGT